jgi:hypothetical protein
MWWSQTGCKWRLNMAHTRCMLDKQGYTHAAHAHAYASGHSHVRMYVCTQARTHRQICNTYCFSTTVTIRERAAVLLYTYMRISIIRFRFVRQNRYANASIVRSSGSMLFTAPVTCVCVRASHCFTSQWKVVKWILPQAVFGEDPPRLHVIEIRWIVQTSP